jgi:glutathionylspermidine amidase/synthetase
MPFECQVDCATPYGQALGVTNSNVRAYSNCDSSCVIYESNYWQNIYTGIKWQCVEYARRWLLANKGMTFSDVDIAADIWNNINHVTEVMTNRSIPVKSYLNGSKQPPEVNDLLIYDESFNDTGHVAVVVNVDHENGLIRVGEQNYSNEVWPGKYAREIKFVNKSGSYWLLEESLIGWKHINNQPRGH